VFLFRIVVLDILFLTFPPVEAVLGLVLYVGDEGHALNKNDIGSIPKINLTQTNLTLASILFQFPPLDIFGHFLQ
jgi:hypothetical protein